MAASSASFALRLALLLGASLAAGTLHAADPAMPALPVLKIEVCDGCRAGPAVTKAIKAAYEDAADYDGYALDAAASITLRIVAYEERDPGAASLFGPLAGRDHIRAELMLAEGMVEIEDSARSVFTNMAVVAENIGIESYRRVADALRRRAPAK